MSQVLDTNGVLRTEGENDRAEYFTWEAGEIALLSRGSPTKTGSNQDAALIVPLAENSLLLAVADGCGGMPSGMEAAGRAIQVLAATCRERPAGDLTAQVLAGFDAANQAVLDMRVGAGTTLAAVLISHGIARGVHVGDSLILIVGQRGRLRFAAKPHSPTGFGVEAGLLTEQEAIDHDERSIVLNVVGSPDMFVEIGQPIKLRPYDTVLLASDGVSDNMLTEEIVGAIRTGPCAKSAEALADAAGERMANETSGHPDDHTLLLFRSVARKRG